MLILLFSYRFQSFSRAVFVIYWGMMLILISLSRLSFRLLKESSNKGNQKGLSTLIYGAGIGGQLAVKEIETNRAFGLALVGFIDDNPKIHQRKIQSYPVLGGLKDLEKIINEYNIREVIISFKENGAGKKQEIKELCLKAGIEVEVKLMRLAII